MNVVLLNLQSNQQIKLDNLNPLIIGRSNVLGCADKRVSRNHGKLACTVDGKIHLIALHTNPCFFTRNGVPPILQLNKNEEETLNEGDCLGLLPDEFWFQITFKKEPDIKTENENLDESISETDCGKKCKTSTLQNNKASSENIIVTEKFNENENFVSSEMNISNTANKSKVKFDGLVENSSGFGSPEFEKTRRLPLWMYEIHDAKNKKKSPAKKTSSSTAEQKHKNLKMFPGTSTKEEEPASSNSGSIEINNKKISLNSPSTSKISNFVEAAEEIANFNNKSSKESFERKSSPLKKEKGFGKYEKDVDVSSGDVLIRPICPYEDSCYRKNPQHKIEFCHPGDVDFLAIENRPLCPYGSACYRKNIKHKTEYRHPPAASKLQPPPSPSSRASSPLPSKRRRKTVKREVSNYEDEDEYDLEDPFINDASSDEYIPSDSYSEEEEEELDFSLKDNDQKTTSE